MIAAQAGDSNAYEALLRDLLPRVRRQVAARVIDPAGREDIVQNVFLSLHRSRHTYRSECSFGAWLAAVVRNASFDWLRSQGRRALRETRLDALEVPEPSVPAVEHSDAISAGLERALAELPASQREAVHLVHVEGLSVAEAAERAGVSRGALKVRAHRGVRALRALLGRSRS